MSQAPRNTVPRPIQDARAIAALLAGATYAQAAEAAGCSERTVRRRREEDAAFRAALEAAYAEALDRVRYSVTTAASQGVLVLVRAATTESVPWPSRVAAAKTLVELTVGKWIAVTGPDGGPIQVTAVTPQEQLLERLERLAPQPVIETRAIEATDPE